MMVSALLIMVEQWLSGGHWLIIAGRQQWMIINHGWLMGNLWSMMAVFWLMVGNGGFMPSCPIRLLHLRSPKHHSIGQDWGIRIMLKTAGHHGSCHRAPTVAARAPRYECPLNHYHHSQASQPSVINHYQPFITNTITNHYYEPLLITINTN